VTPDGRTTIALWQQAFSDSSAALVGALAEESRVLGHHDVAFDLHLTGKS
jgi:hypothetical protein